MDEEPNQQAWADWYNVTAMIEINFYQLLDLFEKFHYLTLCNKDNMATWKLKAAIQVKISKLRSMLQHYSSVKKSKTVFDYGGINTNLSKVFTLIKAADQQNKRLGFKGLYLCKEAIIKAHFDLGLSKIEKERGDPGKAMSQTRGY